MKIQLKFQIFNYKYNLTFKELNIDLKQIRDFFWGKMNP